MRTFHHRHQSRNRNETPKIASKGLKLTLLSQMAIEFRSQWKRTWKSGFSLSWWNSKLSMASDSDLGTPTMRRVKPDRMRKGLRSGAWWEEMGKTYLD